MSSTIVAITQTVVKDGRFQFERDCSGCDGTIVVPCVGVFDKQALWRLATERPALCGICEDERAEDQAHMAGDWGQGHEGQTERDMIGL